MLKLPRTKKGLIAYLLVVFIATFSTLILTQNTPLKIAKAPNDVLESSQTNVLGDSDKTTHFVKRVIDADTIEIANNELIQLIAIDAPETFDNKTSECYANEAKEYLAKLIEGKEVTLTRDFSDYDTFGRKLRYVYLEDTLINLDLVEAGMAKARAYPPDTSMRKELNEAQMSARDGQRGIWANCNQTTSID